MTDPLQTAIAYWERRAEQHPLEAERIRSGEEATDLRRWTDAMNHFRAKHVRAA